MLGKNGRENGTAVELFMESAERAAAANSAPGETETRPETGRELRIGVLIIGSLLWDSKQHRESWRRERLDLDEAQMVRAPIRYGRRSIGRGCSYTMVFSTSLKGQQLGRAMVVPCSNTAKDIASVVAEAERLWTAETSNGRNPNGRISASWGCVALMEHPERQLPDEVRYGWTGRVAEEGCGYGQLNSAVDEEPAVKQQSGFLNIPWPTPLGGSDLTCDVLLATATNPTIVGGGYPSAQQIADWSICEVSDYLGCGSYGSRVVPKVECTS